MTESRLCPFILTLPNITNARNSCDCHCFKKLYVDKSLWQNILKLTITCDWFYLCRHSTFTYDHLYLRLHIFMTLDSVVLMRCLLTATLFYDYDRLSWWVTGCQLFINVHREINSLLSGNLYNTDCTKNIFKVSFWLKKYSFWMWNEYVYGKCWRSNCLKR